MNLDSLDPGVRVLVKLLLCTGFATTDSGDGCSKVALIATGDALDIPHVFIKARSHSLLAEADRLHAFMREYTRTGGAASMWPLFERYRIEATYSPIDGVATLALYGEP